MIMNRLIVISSVLLLAGPALAVPDELEDSYQRLKEAVSQKDPVQVQKLAAETSTLARKTIATPAPDTEFGKPEWTASVAHAKDIDLFTEYALYATAVQAPPATTITLMAALEAQNPKSKYLDEGYGRYIFALTQTGESAKIPPLVQKGIANFPDNEDLLIYLADAALTRKASAQAGTYAERVITVLGKHSKPDTVTQADWERKRSVALGRAYWIAGLVHCEKTEFYQADKDLRAALPLIKDNEAMLAPALFNLGIADYQLGRTTLNKELILDGAKFSEQVAKMKTPLAQQAWTNAHAMRQEALKIR
jgi:hypothetical protein